MPSRKPPAIKALIFDVFGTLVDWRTSIAREAERQLALKGIRLDWLAFADAWRAEYQPAMEEVRAGRIPFSKLDQLHRRNLDIVLSSDELDEPDALDEDARRELNLAWHRLDAWPDVANGLAALRARFLLAPCSNGNISLMVDLARRNGFHWDAILGAELARFSACCCVLMKRWRARPRLPVAVAAVFCTARIIHASRAPA